MDQALLDESKKALKNEHNKLVAELKSFAKADPKMGGNWNAEYPKFEEAESGSHAALEEEADEVEEYEERLEAEHSLESRLLEITKALERIERGDYGICMRCKKEVPPERLRANPAAEYHTEHTP